VAGDDLPIVEKVMDGISPRLADPDTLAAADLFDGGDELPIRMLDDPWSSAVARRAIAFLAFRKIGTGTFSTVQTNPLPLNGEIRTLGWLFQASQAEIDAWRAADPLSVAVLRAVTEWLQRTFATFGGALAAAFPVADLFKQLTLPLDPRDRIVLTERSKGLTLEEVGLSLDLTRERVRQIEEQATEYLISRFASLLSGGHPLALALAAHARTLARRVVAAGSAAETTLSSERRRRWILTTLAGDEAIFLLALYDRAEKVKKNGGEAFDPFQSAGLVLAGGITSLPWSDLHLTAIRNAFARLIRQSVTSWTQIDVLAREADVTEEAVEALAELAELVVDGSNVFVRGRDVATVRRAYLADILSAADRPMHYTEMAEACLDVGVELFSIRDIQRALIEDPDTFATDGNGLWQVRARFGETVSDQRPDSPIMPEPWSEHKVRQVLAAMPPPESLRSHLFTGMDPGSSQFAVEAGVAIATALARVPCRSVGEILTNPSDNDALDTWALRGSLPGWDEGADVTKRARIGLTILSAAVVAARALGHRDESAWVGARGGFGPDLTNVLFNSQSALRASSQTAMLEAVHIHHLRSAFSFRADPWLSLLTLHAGLFRDELASLPIWLAIQQAAPTSVRQLVAEGPNHSSYFACFWNVLAAVQRRVIGAEAVAALAERNPWWPGWEVADVCRALEPSLYRPERRAIAQDSLAVLEAKQGSEVQVGPPEGSEEAVQPSASSKKIDGGLEAPEPGIPSGPTLENPRIWLDASADVFVMELPKYMALPSGPIALSGDGFRVGGAIGEGGAVQWHTEEPIVRLPVKGPSERVITVEPAGRPPMTQVIRLWKPEEYILAYDLRAPERGALDPFVISFPPGRPFAILMHRSLTASEAPTVERGLDSAYVLRIWQGGVPEGTTLSAGGEEVWRAEVQSNTRRLLTVQPVTLTARGKGVAWGGICNLMARVVPEGFIPSRACVGTQVLKAEAAGHGWNFPGYSLLPGMDPLRRRGRIEGRWNGERATIPARIAIEQAPNGGAIRDTSGWHPIDLDAPFNTARHGDATLWVSRPEGTDEVPWYVMEGPCPVASYSSNGVRVAPMRLAALGEPLIVAPQRFDIRGSFVSVASNVTDSGIVVSSYREGKNVSISTETPTEWTDGHSAIIWSAEGVEEVQGILAGENGNTLLVPLPDQTPYGIALFYETAWLGTAHLAANPKRTTAIFLRHAPNWQDALRLAVDARLPLLASEALSAVRARVYADGAGSLNALLEPHHAYAARRILEGWQPDLSLCRSLVERFRTSHSTVALGPTALDALFQIAPCSAIRAMHLGMSTLPRAERVRLMYMLAVRSLPDGMRPAEGEIADPSALVGAEHRLKETAARDERLDTNFLAGRAEASIASLAWRTVSTDIPQGFPENLSTALSLAPVRRWLGVHLIIRLSSLMR